MASYNPYSNKYGNKSATPQPVAQTVTPVEKAGTPIPEDYVSVAESVITGLSKDRDGKLKLTTSKLRNLFGAYCDLYNEIARQAGPLTSTQKDALTVARIRIVYESGRDNDVKSFVTNANLIEHLLWIGDSTENFIRFYHYFEALVAYHRYYGGK